VLAPHCLTISIRIERKGLKVLRSPYNTSENTPDTPAMLKMHYYCCGIRKHLLETGNSTVTPVVSNLRSTLIRIDPALVDSGDSGCLPDSHFFLPPQFTY